MVTAYSGTRSSLNERHLIDLFQRRDPGPGLVERALAQERHPFIACGAADLRRRALVENQFADLLAQIQQLMNRAAPAESGPAAFKTSGAFIKSHVPPGVRAQPAFDQI